MIGRPYIINGFGLSYLRIADYRPGEENLQQGHPSYVAGSEQTITDKQFTPVAVPNQTPFNIDAAKVSFLNTPVWSDLLLRYQDQEVYFDTCLIEVSQTKLIVKTAVVGRNGTVKEYISDGDYMVSIRSAIVSRDKNYPEDAVRNLLNILKVNKELEAVSPVLNMCGIYSIVVEDYRMPSIEGYVNTQLCEINAASDTPIELIQDDTTNI